ncbi:MAG: hypothetical protein ABW208_27855 [Pyrinomonadaceae bacterium]
MASRTKSAGVKGRARRPPPPPPLPERRVERVRRLLLRRSLPRVWMSLILAATGAAGFLASFLMLHLGVSRMWLRYPLAVLFAYAVFIVLLRVWLFLHGRDVRGGASGSELDTAEVGTEIVLDSVGRPLPDTFGGGGDFGGGGAGGSWGEGVSGGLQNASTAYDAGGVASGGGGGNGGGGGGLLSGLDLFDADSEGCVFFLLALALIVAGVCASLYVVYAAPLLLAEILVEGVLLSGLYRGMKRARRGGGGDWLGAALRRTWLPVLLTLLTFAAAGYLLQRAAPRARSIGEAFRMVTSD